MSQTPTPNKGCFESSYPSTEWHEVPCTTAPNQPYVPAKGPRSETVGNGTDFAAGVSGAPISSAIGSFDRVDDVTSESDQKTANRFALQLNTRPFSSPACKGAKIPSKCQGWQQFIYSNDGCSSGTACAFIQYWLLDYATRCPSGWNTYGSDCWTNGPNAVSVPVQTIADLGMLSLEGQASSGGKDTVIMATASGSVHAANQDSILTLSPAWTAAEFNIFGDCCSTEAVFNAGLPTIVVRTSVNNGTTEAPSCLPEGYTGETNSLTLVPPCCPVRGAPPAIVLEESGAAGATNTCFTVQAFQALSATEILVLGANGNLWLEHGPFGKVPPTRQQVDGNVQAFQALSATEVLVLGTNGNLWLEYGPFGTVPPPRQQVDGNVAAFQALSATEALVLGKNGNLWLEVGPFGKVVPPPRQEIDANVKAFKALSATEVLVLGTNGNLWLEHAPFGKVPPTRQQVDGNVEAFQALSDTEILVLGANGNLWLEHGPFGKVPPPRQQVDGNVASFQALSATEAVVLGTNHNLWLELGPFGKVPPTRQQVDGNVQDFHALTASQILVLGTNGNLWLEQGPFGKVVPPARTEIDANVF
ncbi:MAG TPA: hypothetical protein VME69_17050 [Methylocella sp.]|nr:hypothetical protein [Methylocella sp.]